VKRKLPGTFWFVVSMSALALGWELWKYKTGGVLISPVMLWLTIIPAIPYTFGVLGGHFFWPRHENMPSGKAWIVPAVIWVGLVVWQVTLSLALSSSEWFMFLVDHPIVPFAGGILSGHLFWPQRLKLPREKL
jgi:hypothetical protein